MNRGNKCEILSTFKDKIRIHKRACNVMFIIQILITHPSHKQLAVLISNETKAGVKYKFFSIVLQLCKNNLQNLKVSAYLSKTKIKFLITNVSCSPKMNGIASLLAAVSFINQSPILSFGP